MPGKQLEYHWGKKKRREIIWYRRNAQISGGILFFETTTSWG
jgi:hypothetical protein